MNRRAAAVEETRRRIVDATLELHAEQGIAATRYDEIAARAGVGVGTVYRHFPSLDELVPACGRVSMALLALPDPAEAPARFAGADEPRARLEHLVGEVLAIYERGDKIVRVVLRERDAHPHVAGDAATIEAALDALVDAALEPLKPGSHERRLTRAMLDIGTWTALREHGLEPHEAADAVTAMLACHLDRRQAAAGGRVSGRRP